MLIQRGEWLYDTTHGGRRAMNNIGGMFKGIVLMGGLFSHFFLNAQTLTSELESLQESSKVFVRGDVSFYSSNEVTPSQGANQLMEAVLNVDYKTSAGKLYLKLSGHQDLSSSQQKTQMNNTSFGLSLNPIKLSESVLLIQKFYGYLPTNEDSRKLESFQTAAGGSSLFYYSHPLASFYYRFNAKKNSHQFSQNSSAEFNISHSVDNLLGAEITRGKWTLNLDTQYITAWNYNNRLKATYLLAQTLSYQASSAVTLSLGHYHQSEAFKANGTENNFKLFDVRTSYIYAGISIRN